MNRQVRARAAALAASLLVLFGAAASVSGTVWTDQADYSPGSIVTISGNNEGVGYFEVNRVKRPHTGKGLGDSGHAEKWRGCFCV